MKIFNIFETDNFKEKEILNCYFRTMLHNKKKYFFSNKYIEKAKEKQEPNQHALNETPPVDADNKPLKKLQDNLEEKYAKHVNKNGKLNSRKVFEILQKEDAKQEKVCDSLNEDLYHLEFQSYISGISVES